MFRVGDEVVCVDDRRGVVTGRPVPVVKGRTYIVTGLHWDGGIYPDGLRASNGAGLLASRFRKVQRKASDLSIEAFLTIKPGFEEPKRAPKKERVS